MSKQLKFKVMVFKGTKGEWKAIEYSKQTKIGYSTHEIQYGEDGECVAEVVHGESNAKLIASAPDLLEELMYIYNAYDLGETDRFRIKKAIEKALK